MPNKNKFIALVFIILMKTGVAQIDVGGTCGLGVTNNFLTLDCAPEVAYRFVENIRVGVSPFILYNSKLGSSYWNRMYGARVFSEYQFSFNVIVHAEYEISNYSDSEGYHKNMSSLPIGIGGSTSLSERMEGYALVLYDVLYDESSTCRTNPMFRAGVRYKF